ncbi:MAG: hypothetical protein OXS47_04065 [Chloroflexota bacterium]|nr:hypothetical protein [Chloroflexota bacterium]
MSAGDALQEEARQLGLLISPEDPVLLLVERLERIFRPALDENLPGVLARELTAALHADEHFAAVFALAARIDRALPADRPLLSVLEERVAHAATPDPDFAQDLAEHIAAALLENTSFLAALGAQAREAAQPDPDFATHVANQVAAALQGQSPRPRPAADDDAPREPSTPSPAPPRPPVGQVLAAAATERAERLSDALEPLGRPSVTLLAIVVALLAGAGLAYLSIFFF